MSSEDTNTASAPMPAGVDRRMLQASPDKYESSDGYVLQREYGMTPNGNPMGGRWALRSADGRLLDFDRYRNDVAERHQLTLNPPGSTTPTRQETQA